MERVCVLGAGSFGSAISRVIAQAPATAHIKLWARREEIVREINDSRTNTQYIPDARAPLFPLGVLSATSSIEEALTGATMIVVGVPSQFLPSVLAEVGRCEGVMGESPVFVSLVKSLHYDTNRKTVSTISEEIAASFQYRHPVTCVMGPNLYAEMVRDEFAEATIGYLPTPAFSQTSEGGDVGLTSAQRVQAVLSTPAFQASLCADRLGVELCGGLKNVVSLAAGFVEGLGLGANTKAAVIRAGVGEMARFGPALGLRVRPDTFHQQSCGIGDLVLTCQAGRGRTLAAAFVKEYSTSGPAVSVEDSAARWANLEERVFEGMKLPDWHNARIVYTALQAVPGAQTRFPLFSAIYEIAFRGADPQTIIGALRQSVASPGPCSSSPSHGINLSGQRALVTGAAGGIGQEIVRVLAECGARVVALDRDGEGLTALQQKFGCEILSADLMDVPSLTEKLREAVAQGGPIQLIVNSAGIANFQPFHETSPDVFDRTYAINVRAAIAVTQTLTQALVEQGIGGSVVNISSQSSTLPIKDHLVYSSSKAAIDHVTRIQALELGPHNIRVNAVRPTVVLTELAKNAWDPVELEKMAASVPLGRLAAPAEVAGTVAWLLSDQTGMVTGSCVAVDGGRAMGGFGM